MTKSRIYFALLALLDVISIFVTYGSFLEINGIISYLIFFVLIALNIVFMKKYGKKFNKIILCILLFFYVVSGGIFLIREDGRRIIHETKTDNYIYITYEINPGAMSHISYEDIKYYSIIDTDLLTVRIVKSSKHHRYIG